MTIYIALSFTHTHIVSSLSIADYKITNSIAGLNAHTD
uniref:Uncharacterized protein n=1 Tax=Arundo donax TaxID=35708 RepID=A0A0A9T2K5_ARUDO